MTYKSAARMLGLGLFFLTGCANQSVDQPRDGKSPHAGTMMQDPDMKKRCGKMMERHGQKGMMHKRKHDEQMDMKGCHMMKSESPSAPAPADAKAPENPDDHSAHHPQP